MGSAGALPAREADANAGMRTAAGARKEARAAGAREGAVKTRGDGEPETKAAA